MEKVGQGPTLLGAVMGSGVVPWGSVARPGLEMRLESVGILEES